MPYLGELLSILKYVCAAGSAPTDVRFTSNAEIVPATGRSQFQTIKFKINSIQWARVFPPAVSLKCSRSGISPDHNKATD